jgi:hypothetical protein
MHPVVYGYVKLEYVSNDVSLGQLKDYFCTNFSLHELAHYPVRK